MKRILTALGNPVLNNELRKYEKYDVISEDLFYQEAVIDIAETESIDTIIISGVLQGQDDLLEFVTQIKRKNGVARIIIITDEIKENERNALVNMGVFDVLYDSEVDIPDVIEAIDREQPMIKNVIKETKTMYDSNEECVEKISYVTKIQKQEVITVSGINGIGKSTFVAKFSKKLSEKSDSKILVIDLDTLNGNLDEIMGINKVPQNVDFLMDDDKKCGLNYAVDLIVKNRFDANVLDELVIHEKGIDVLTGNTSLHYCQNVLKEEYYAKILMAAKEKYDFIILDTSSNIFLDSTKWALQEASKVIFITENSYIGMKKSSQLLSVVLNVWGVWKNKISLVINETSNNNVESEVVERILQGIKVIGSVNEKSEYDYEKILSEINFIPKLTFKEKIERIKNAFESKLKAKEVQNAN